MKIMYIILGICIILFIGSILFIDSLSRRSLPDKNVITIVNGADSPITNLSVIIGFGEEEINGKYIRNENEHAFIEEISMGEKKSIALADLGYIERSIKLIYVINNETIHWEGGYSEQNYCIELYIKNHGLTMRNLIFDDCLHF